MVYFLIATLHPSDEGIAYQSLFHFDICESPSRILDARDEANTKAGIRKGYLLPVIIMKCKRCELLFKCMNLIYNIL